jgi:hypothetical protein
MKRKSTQLLVALLLLAPATAAALTPLGVHAGFSVDPDQFVFGGHAIMAEPLIGWQLHASLDFGFGDNVTSIIGNGDFVYAFPELATADWRFYVGGGVGVGQYSYDHPDPTPPGFDDSDTQFGLNIVGGITRRLLSGNELLGELRIGVEDMPDVKIVAGFTF